MTDASQLTRAYLRRLRRAAKNLPRARRQELISQIADHIAEARRAAPTGHETAAVGEALQRLGEPAAIVAAEGISAGRRHRPGVLETIAVIMVLIGGVVLPVVGWIIGVVLLWVSPRWRWPDKLLGTLVWPGGLLSTTLFVTLGTALLPDYGTSTPSPTTVTCSAAAYQRYCAHNHVTAYTTTSSWMIPDTLVALGVLVPIAVAIWLLLRVGPKNTQAEESTEDLVRA